MDNDKQMHMIQDEMMGSIEFLLEQGCSLLAIAGMMANVALGLYKAGLNDEEYNKMVDLISESRGRIVKVGDAKPTVVH